MNIYHPLTHYTKKKLPTGYYVYFYLREDFTPYYVGKGKGRRAYSKNHGRVPVPKDKSKILICHETSSEIYALILERYYIRWFGKKMNGGILLNIDDGGVWGGWPKGRKQTPEHTKNRAEARKGWVPNEETRKIWSSQRTGITSPNKGLIKTENQKIVDRLAQTSRKQVLGPDGIIYSSLRDASRHHTNITRPTIRKYATLGLHGWSLI